jgi:pimeloyl-ACP methyl ester carboxylesterase
MQPLAEALAGDARVWVPDLPGHGAHRDSPFTLDAALVELSALVASAGATPVVVAGDSLGGYLALALAAQLGDRIVGVVAGGCTFPMGGAWSLGAALTDLPVTAAAMLAGSDRVERALLRAFKAAGGTAGVAERTRELGLRLAARGESIRALRRFDLAAAVHAATCPVTFVNGARDVPIVWLAERYARIARQGHAVRIPGTGHGVMTLTPLPVAAEIRRLLRER